MFIDKADLIGVVEVLLNVFQKLNKGHLFLAFLALLPATLFFVSEILPSWKCAFSLLISDNYAWIRANHLLFTETPAPL